MIKMELYPLFQTQLTPIGSEVCHAYAIIREKDGSSEAVTVCGGRERFRHVYYSRSNQVEVRVFGRKNTDKSPQFLLKFEGRSFVITRKQSLPR